MVAGPKTIDPTRKMVKGTKGYATDIKRVFVKHMCVMKNGDFDTEIF